MDPEQIKKFLQKIGLIESQGGKNVQHPVIQKGVNKGHQAIGTYGLTPNIVYEILDKRAAQEGEELPIELENAYQLDPKPLKHYLEKNPNLQDQIAGSLAQHLLEKHKGDENKAAYAWNMGTSLSPEQITPEKLSQSPYVQKFQKLQKVIPSLIPQNRPLQTQTDQPDLYQAFSPVPIALNSSNQFNNY